MALEDYLSGQQRNAYDALTQQFSQYGLGTLAPKIFDFIQKGFSADTISLLLQDTPEYKERFSGNEARRKAGLPVLSPAEYLATESSYRQIMRASGMPEGFYDQPSDFHDFISKDVSPTELKSRVDLASQESTLANPAAQQALKELYGVDQAHVAAYFLDPDRAEPLLRKQAMAANIGGEALKRGLSLNKDFLEYTVGAGTTQSQAATAYSQIAAQLPQYQTIGHQFGTDVNQRLLEYAFLEPNTTGFRGDINRYGEPPTATLERLASWQRAQAQGQVGAARGGTGASASGQV